MPNNPRIVEITDITQAMFNNLLDEDFDLLMENQARRETLLLGILNDHDFLQEHSEDCIEFYKLNVNLSEKMAILHKEIESKLVNYYKGQDAANTYSYYIKNKLIDSSFLNNIQFDKSIVYKILYA